MWSSRGKEAVDEWGLIFQQGRMSSQLSPTAHIIWTFEVMALLAALLRFYFDTRGYAETIYPRVLEVAEVCHYLFLHPAFFPKPRRQSSSGKPTSLPASPLSSSSSSSLCRRVQMDWQWCVRESLAKPRQCWRGTKASNSAMTPLSVSVMHARSFSDTPPVHSLTGACEKKWHISKRKGLVRRMHDWYFYIGKNLIYSL